MIARLTGYEAVMDPLLNRAFKPDMNALAYAYHQRLGATRKAACAGRMRLLRAVKISKGGVGHERSQGRRRSFKMRLAAAPAEQAFPLLCPTREYDWIDTWQCQHGLFGVGPCRTGLHLHDRSFPADGPEDTWVVCQL
ncbi:MAG: hypothetical protein MZV70_51465 [Desulfobacterales bacterium]|nr:hypothetical protein [Desulfobacterales bacterium]